MSKINYQLDSNTTFLTGDVFDYPTIEKTLILPSYSTVIERVAYFKSLSSPNIHAGLTISGVSGETINFQTSNFMSSMYSVTLQSLPDAAGGNWGILNRYPDLLNNVAYKVNTISSSVNINTNQNNSLLFVNTLTSSKTIVLPKISDISPSMSTSYTYTIKDLRGSAGLSSIYLSTSGGDVLENFTVPSLALNDAFGSVDLIAQPNKNQWLITNYYSGQLTDNLSLEYGFSFTGVDQRFVVPGSITYFRVFLWGAGGGYSAWNSDRLPYPTFGAGGGGGYTTGILPVIPGETLTIMVGCGPGNHNAEGLVIRTTSNFYTSNYFFIYGGGGPGRDINGNPNRAPGGGRSAIFRGTTSANLNQELCTAGGGGAGGGFSRLGGGAGGGLIGLRSDGVADTETATFFSAYGGGNPRNFFLAGGGGQTEGGKSFDSRWNGQRGQAFQNDNNLRDASSGGGGYYGGGTGTFAEGGSGGGSGFIGGLIGGYTEAGNKNIPGGVNVSFRPSYVGYGFSPGIANLGHGYVLLKYP